MSRIGQKPIPIPPGVEVKVHDAQVLVKGPLGQLQWSLFPGIHAQVDNGVVSLTRGGFREVKGYAWINQSGNF